VFICVLKLLTHLPAFLLKECLFCGFVSAHWIFSPCTAACSSPTLSRFTRGKRASASPKSLFTFAEKILMRASQNVKSSLLETRQIH